MKNLRNFVANIATIVMGALMYVFMACPYTSTTVLNQTQTSSLFKAMEAGIMKDELGWGHADYSGHNLSVVMGYILAVFAGILILVGIVNLFVDFGVIKSTTVAKALKFVNIIAAIVAVVATACALIGVCHAIKESKVTKIGWAAIVNIVVAVVAVVAALLVKIAKKKSKKK